MKFNRLKFLFFLVTAASVAHAEFTVHILNPWAADSTRAKLPVYIQSSESGWYPGTAMTSDFGGWLTYTFTNSTTASNDRMEFMSVIPDINDSYANKKYYRGGSSQIIISTIFAGHDGATDIWLTVTDTTKPPQIRFTSPPYKVFRFFKPWEIGGAYVEIKGTGTFRMAGTGDYCGWLTFKYFTDADNLSVRFRNTLNNAGYGAGGPGNGDYINLSALFAAGDTAWILGSAAGPPTAGSVFPGTLGDCAPIKLASKLRDIDSTHPDFQVGACSSGREAYPGMVAPRLGSNGKPVKSAAITCITKFDWFEAQVFGNGYTNEKCYNLTLHKNDEGLYFYDTTEFFPLDSFQYLDAAKTVRNPNGALQFGHNYSFTMETRAEFEYVPGQEFYFRGDDDVWVFIDSELVVDLGGVHYPIEGSVDLDTLGLTPGKTYSFILFFSERNCCGSSFRMVTSIALRTSSKLYFTDTLLAPGRTQYDIFEKITQDNMACDASEIPSDTVRATVEFYIEGSPFAVPLKLPAGTSYDGITILPDYSGVIIDEPSITGLPVGTYQIHYYSAKDRSMEGVFTFVVTARPQFNNKVDRAAYFADNGRGAVDRVEVYFTDTLEMLPDSVLLCWPAIINGKLVTGGIVPDLANKRHLTIHLAEPFPGEITKYNGDSRLGRFYFHDSAYTPVSLITVPFSIADSVGPLIRSAVLVERVEPGNDTILLTFSEPLKEAVFTGQPIVLFKNGQKINLTALNTFSRGDTTVFVIKDQGLNAPGLRDSVALNSAGPVRDVFGNTAHPENRPVPFITRKIPGKVINAWYLDTDADGLVDRATLQFNKAVLLSDFTATFAWKLPQTPPLDSSRFSYGLDSTEVQVNLSGVYSRQPVLTSGAMLVYIRLIGQETGRDTPVADSAAPVLTSALLHPGISQSGVRPPDTLIVTFSEPIAGIGCPMPFLFSRSGPVPEAHYQMSLSVLKNSGDQWSFTVTAISGVEFPSTGDSVWINDTCGLADTSSNRQLHHNNHRVPLTVSTIPIFYIVKVGPNPLRLSNTAGGTELRVESSVKQKQFVKYDVDIALYDAVGNIVVKNHLESRNSPTTTVSYTWNGCNRRGRIVGCGTYLAVITVHDLLRGTFDKVYRKIGVVR